MFVVRDWIELDEFGLGLANGKYYIEQESKRVSVNLIVVVTYFYRCWKHEIHVVHVIFICRDSHLTVYILSINLPLNS